MGAAVSVLYFSRFNLQQLVRQFAQIRAIALVGVISLTLLHLMIRWMRWQFLLRRIQIRIPTRYSVEVFTYGLAMILTPAYVGECIKAWLIKTRYHYKVQDIIAVVVAERIFDVLALLTLWVLGTRLIYFLVIIVMILLLVGFAGTLTKMSAAIDRTRQLFILRTAVTPAAEVLRKLLSGKNFLASLFVSCCAWGLVGMSLYILTWGFHQDYSLLQGLQAFSKSTLIGAVTLIPGGIGVSGSILIVSLKTSGFSLETAEVIVFLLRLLTLWLAVSLGILAMLYRSWQSKTPVRKVVTDFHFDRISDVYDTDIVSHVRDQIVLRKIILMSENLIRNLPAGSVGLDIGCGRGWYVSHFAAKGYKVTAFDLSFQQASVTKNLLQRSHLAAPVVVSDVLNLPFQAKQFDFVYAINIFHHLKTPQEQQQAFRQVAKILRPGGIFFLHEINITNLLFRFYMNYVFPLLHHIDEGTERWILPKNLSQAPGFSIEKIEYRTFIPDFLPKFLMKPALALEKRLEQSSLKSWSAHYMAVLRSENYP